MVSESKLIDALAQDLKPVKRVSLPLMIALWGAVALGVGGFMLWRVGIRHDIADKLAEVDYILALIFYFSSFVLASILALRSAVPGRLNNLQRSLLMVSGLSILSVLTYSGIFRGQWQPIHSFDGWEALGCCLRISFGAILPASIILGICVRLAPFQIKKTIAMGWLASAVLVSIVSQLNCPIEGVGHAMIGHGLLLFLVGAVAWAIFYVVGSFVIDWSEAKTTTRITDRLNRKK